MDSKKDQGKQQGSGETKAKLQLICPFTFWFQPKQSSQKFRQEQAEYEGQLKKIGSFDTVEEFWAYYQHMVRPDQLPEQAQFFLFQSDIKPMWEDQANKNGGRFFLRIKKKYSNRVWEDLLLAFIGQQGEEVNWICGVILQVKDQFCVLNIWTKDLQIGEQREKKLRNWITSSLGFSPNVTMEYKQHPKEEDKEKVEKKLAEVNPVEGTIQK